MFNFDHDHDVSLLTVTRTGFWSLETVAEYEAALRNELRRLHQTGRPTACIVDIRPSGAQSQPVADALRAMVARLGPLDADRTAVVTNSGIAKLQARQIAHANVQIFTSMILARDWVTDRVRPAAHSAAVETDPGSADAEGGGVHVVGPGAVDIMLSPQAAIERAKRINDAAIEVLLAQASRNGAAAA